MVRVFQFVRSNDFYSLLPHIPVKGAYITEAVDG
jgi:hypothetical protein